MSHPTVHTPLDRLLAIAVALLVAVALVIVATTLPELPPTVATHFGLSGAANGWMSHRAYSMFIVAFTLGLPLAIWALVALVPRHFPRLAKIAHRDAWLTAPHRASTLQRLDRYGRIQALAGVLLAIGLNALVVAKNVPSGGLASLVSAIVVLVVAVLALLATAIAMKRAFRRPP